ncbi:4-hydroxy-3-methylbut-2-enyl diphosphate reductase [Alkalithermobacter paradoxus]|uniref:4-hydroxy-3-methylbut-2-enyl diphosphate reductase n=1 Tax=Alkalithermobacter paradoxus TaxID=29349 RepID=UPI00117BFD90
MEIKIAKYAGFCFGVERAMDRAWKALENNSKIYSLGPLIHNSQAVKKYEEKGLQIIDDLGTVGKGDTVIIRSHGVPLDVYIEAEKKEVNIIDLTCPYVKKIQNIASKYYNEGYKIIIIGDPNHPEVIGINGWCNNDGIIVKKIEDLDKVSRNNKYCVVAQTTMNLQVYDQICNKLKDIIADTVFFNTICSATKERQEAAMEISKTVDAMIVIGGVHSSNTQKLVQICSQFCKTYAIETIEDLDLQEIAKCSNVGITAGASTPDWVIDNVIDKIKSL